MDFKEFVEKAKEVKFAYAALNRSAEKRQWSAREYTEGLVGDVGDLMKLVMAREDFRKQPEELDERIRHELADCLWSVIVIADELGVDLEDIFFKTITELSHKINSELKQLLE